MKKATKKKKRGTSKSSKKRATPVVMVCSEHKTYSAIYPPKTDCLVCWKIYATRMQFMVKVLKTQLKELKNARR